MEATRKSIEFRNHTIFKTTWNDVSVVCDENGFYNLTRLCIENGYRDLNYFTRNKYWKDFDTKIRSEPQNCVGCENIYSITDGANIPEEYRWIVGTYYPEIYVHVILEHVKISYSIKVSSLMMLINKELKERNITLDNKIKDYENKIEEMKLIETESANIKKQMKIDDIKANGETFSKVIYNGFELIVRDKDGSVNFTDLFRKLRSNTGYSFKDYVSENNTLWSVIEGYYENGLESEILCGNNKIIPSKNIDNSDSIDYIPSKSLNSCGGVDSPPSKNIDNSDSIDFKSLKHNVTTLQFLGLCVVIKGGSNASITGSYFNKNLLNAFLINLSNKYYCLVSKIMDEFDRRFQVSKESAEEQLKKYKTETDVIIKRLKEENKIINEKYNNSNSAKRHDKPGSIWIEPAKTGSNVYKIHFMQSNISADDELFNGFIISDIYNIKDIQNLIRFYLLNGKYDFASCTGGNNFKISDIDKMKEFIADLQKYNFRFDYNVDSIIEKFISRIYNFDTNYFQGHMFEFYCSKHFDIPVYKFERTELLALTKIDEGIDLMDIEKKIIAQCKFYKFSRLSLRNLKTFIGFCKDESFKDWKHLLLVNDDIKIEDDVKTQKCFEIIFVNHLKFEIFMRNYKDKINEKEIKNKRKMQTLICIQPNLQEEIREYVKCALKERNEVRYEEILYEVQEIFEPRSDHPITEYVFKHSCSDLYKKDHSDSFYKNENGERILINKSSHLNEEEFIIQTIGYGTYFTDEYVSIHNEKFHTRYNVQTFSREFRHLFERETAGKLIRVNDRSVFNLIKEDREEMYRKYFEEHPFSTMKQFNDYFHRYENEQTWRKISFVEINDIEKCKAFVTENKDNPRLVTIFNKKFRRGHNKRNFKKEEILALIEETF